LSVALGAAAIAFAFLGQNDADAQTADPTATAPAGGQAVPGEIPYDATQAVAAANPVRPEWVNHPLPADHQAYVDQLLAYWEQSSDQVKRYQCTFRRWEYVPEFCNWRDPQTNKLAAYRVGRGTVRFSAPDRGMYEVTELYGFKAPTAEGSPPDYQAIEGNTEKWICDGAAVYQFDYQNKVLYDMPLPPSMQNEGLRHSPLPFMFGAKADELRERFWIRPLVREGAPNDQYWLEIVPKRAEDARNYQRVELMLSRDPFLPASLHVMAPNYDERTNPTSTVFVFEDRQINGHLAALQDFMGFFVRPTTPLGWERVEKKILADERQAGLPDIGAPVK